MKAEIHRQLHALEDDIIQVGGLFKALQALDCDDAAQISLLQVLEKQFCSLERNFYTLWKEIADGNGR